MSSLTNTNIDDTYKGLIKTINNNTLPGSNRINISDGDGNSSSLYLGRYGNGACIIGQIVSTQGASFACNTDVVNLFIGGTGQFTGGVEFQSSANFNDSVAINSNLTTSTLSVTGTSTFNNTITGSDLKIQNNIEIGGQLYLTDTNNPSLSSNTLVPDMNSGNIVYYEFNSSIPIAKPLNLKIGTYIYILKKATTKQVTPLFSSDYKFPDRLEPNFSDFSTNSTHIISFISDGDVLYGADINNFN